MKDEVRIGPFVFEHASGERGMTVSDGNEALGWCEIVTDEEWDAFVTAASSIAPVDEDAKRPADGGLVTRGAARALMEDWAQGRRSHINELMAMEVDVDHRQATLVAVAQADAQEVVKWAAVYQALGSGA